MKIAYFDCFSGISGDMCLGALVDAGAPLGEIVKGLGKLKLKGYSLSERKVLRAGLTATKIDVSVKKPGAVARRWSDIEKIIAASSLPEGIRQKGREIFRSLFETEAKVHAKSYRTVHLHELGAVDCLVDIFGTLTGLDLLGVESVCCSPLNLGSGTVQSDHGILPVPAPATAEILRGVPVYSAGPAFELTTPTGAALIKSLAGSFGEMPQFMPERIGAGAGGREFADRPNILRIFIGEAKETEAGERITVIETNIDDMTPQAYEYLFAKLFQQGALDVSMTQIIMKKMRPAVRLTVLCDSSRLNELASVILRETTSIGIRYHETSRITLARTISEVKTKYGKVRVKVSSLAEAQKIMPEYEDCKKRAEEKGVPLLEVMEEAKRAVIRSAAGK